MDDVMEEITKEPYERPWQCTNINKCKFKKRKWNNEK
jgi:hypothetical protein